MFSSNGSSMVMIALNKFVWNLYVFACAHAEWCKKPSPDNYYHHHILVHIYGVFMIRNERMSESKRDRLWHNAWLWNRFFCLKMVCRTINTIDECEWIFSAWTHRSQQTILRERERETSIRTICGDSYRYCIHVSVHSIAASNICSFIPLLVFFSPFHSNNIECIYHLIIICVFCVPFYLLLILSLCISFCCSPFRSPFF